MWLRTLSLAVCARSEVTALRSDQCSPTGTWFSQGDHSLSDPISVVADCTSVVSEIIAGADCPGTPQATFKASTAKHWKNDTLCLYKNNSLWYQQQPHGDSGVFGILKYAAPCDSIKWQNGAVWCRGTSKVCFPPTPVPTPPPAPLNWTVFAVPKTGVKFSTTNKRLNDMFAKGEKLAAGNVKSFMASDSGPIEVMVEGSEYKSAWIETQPMAGAMYAQRNVRVVRCKTENRTSRHVP